MDCGHSGRWNDDVTPKRGWTFTGVEYFDVGQICEMCQRTRIQYVYTLSHAACDYELEVGCVCAGWMTGDLDRMKDAEQEAKNRVIRRQNVLKRRWKMNPLTNELSLRMGGYIAKVWRVHGSGFQCAIFRISDGLTLPGKKRYATLEEAKLAVFDAVEAYGERDGLNTKGSKIGCYVPPRTTADEYYQEISDARYEAPMLSVRDCMEVWLGKPRSLRP